MPYDERYLELSWIWLNDPETKLLTMTPDFRREQQRAFFEGLPSRTGYHIWGVEVEGAGPIGAAGIKNVNGNTGEYWGYIGEKQFRGRGLGQAMLLRVEQKALELGLTRLTLLVLEKNEVAIAVYRKAHFSRTCSDGTVVRMEKTLTWPL